VNDDELDPDARALVDLARGARSPSNEQRDRAYQALLAGIAGGATLGAAQGAAAKLAGKSAFVWLKWAVPAAIAVSVGVGAYLWHAQRVVPAPPPHSVVSASPPAPIAIPVAPSVSSVEAVAPSAAPEPSAAPVVKAPTSSKPSADDLVQELGLLHQALAESRSGHAARALELARQHAQRYPASRLRVERDAIEVRSLCALGRAAEARKIADRLRAQAPNSPVSAALAETCVGK
jgi:hypothetical protein